MKKRNIRLMNLILCVLCVTGVLSLASIGAQAEEKEITYVENVTYTQDNTAPMTPEGYEGYLFAGWYVKGGSNVNSAGYSPVSSPVVGKAYYAKYVPTEVLGVKAQVSPQIRESDAEKIKNNITDNVIRFVTSLDSTEYQHIGFYITISGTSYAQHANTSKYVYETIYGMGAEKNDVQDYSPTIFHKQSQFFKTYAFTDIPETAFDSDITVTPYWITLDGTRVYGTETAVRTVNYCRAWVYVDDSTDAVTNAAAPAGTSSNPYTDLKTAVKHDGQKLIPKVILKSDMMLSSKDDAFTITKALTLASEQDADGNVKSIERAAGFTSGRMITVSPASGTVTFENITIDGKELGACVNVSAGTLHMKEGSTITNGKLTGSGKSDTYTGANVVVQAACTLTMESDSLISNGSTNAYGGNILLRNGYLTMNGGTVTGGRAITTEDNTTDQMGCGGNVHAFASSIITLGQDAVISNGEVSSLADVAKTGRGGNISSTGTVIVNGGTISGGKASSSTENTETGCGGNLYLSSSKFTFTDGQISDGTAIRGGNIYVDNALTLSSGTISGGNAAYGGNVYVACSSSTAEDGTINYKLATLTMKGGTISGGRATIAGGNVYTAGKMTMSGGTITGGRAIAEVVQDESGKTVSPSHEIGIGGNICVAGTKEEEKDAVYATVTITGGTIENGQANGRGGNIDAHQYANLVLGTKSAQTNDIATIAGGSVSNTVGNANGGNIFARGNSTVTIYNGITIRDGSAGNQGGNILFDSPEAFVINGGSIQDGTAAGEGGNCYFSEKCVNVTLNDGNISGGKAQQGGNIYVTRKNTTSDGVESTTFATVTMNGGTIESGWATDDGGNIYCHGEFIMNDGTITAGIAGSARNDSYRGGNIYVHGASKTAQYVGKVTVNAGSITGGMAGGRGGNIHLSHATLSLGSGVINITEGQIVTIASSDATEPVVTPTSVTSYCNVSMYGNTTPRQIIIEGTMNLASQIGISVSSSETVDGVTKKNIGPFATGATEYFNKYQRIFISDVADREITISDDKLSIGVVSDSVGYYTAEDYLADESLFVPSWKGVWNPPAELLDFEKKWEAFFTPNGRLMSMAHRGDNDICYPEDSIEGIMSCIQAGVDFVELDVRITKDGVFVLMHDEKITRTTNVTELRTAGVTGLPESDYICDWTLEELRQLRLVYEGSDGDVVTNYVIPTLEDAIMVCKDKIFVFLDNKASATWKEELYPLVKEYEAQRSVWMLPHLINNTGLPNFIETIEADSGYKAAFQAAVTPDTVATVVAKIEENNLPKALRSSDYDPTYDTAYADYFGKYRISTNALYGTYKNNLEEWIKLYQKGYNTLHVDDYMTLVQYIAEQLETE